MLLANEVFDKSDLTNLIFVSSISDKVPASTLDETPPPVKYLTVSVVFEGAIPYEFVNTKFNGEYAVVNFVFSNGKPEPTLSGLGMISSSLSPKLPDQN